MTDEQEERVKTMRENGIGYVCIGRELGISENTVRSFCRRKGLTAGRKAEHPCLYCGREVEQTPGRKEKKFCSDACRMKWWNSHPENVNRKAVYGFVCPCCGKAFTAYGNAKRKYCSHACYVADRFGRSTASSKI